MAFKLSGLASSPGPTYEDWLREWDWCWITQDAEAAAELGRTLLERSRELESTVRHQQAVIDDQAQEMQHWRKQNRGLRQAAESRLRLCEQLESAVAESERTKSLLRRQIEEEQRRHTILKRNLEAAEERGDELQRLLDASKASEAQALKLLRSLQQSRLVEAAAETSIPTNPINPQADVQQKDDDSKEDTTSTMCRLMEDLAEMEERLLTAESDWMEEKRKRMQLETELIHLNRENQRLQEEKERDSADMNSHSASSSPSSITAATANLSLSDELLLSSGDFSSSQWNEAWDNSGPLSLVGSVLTQNQGSRNAELLDEELSSDSSSSGFSDEKQHGIHKTTQTEDTTHLPTVRDENDQDYKSLFRELFAVIRQNL